GARPAGWRAAAAWGRGRHGSGTAAWRPRGGTRPSRSRGGRRCPMRPTRAREADTLVTGSSSGGGRMTEAAERASVHEVLGTRITMPVRIRTAHAFMATYAVPVAAAQRIIDYSGLRVLRLPEIGRAHV